MYSNVDGIVSKGLEISDLIKKDKPLILCLCETKLDTSISLDIMGWSDYNIWRRDRRGKMGGGVLILTHMDLKVNEIDLGENNAEIMALEIIIGENKTDIMVVYMPPFTRAWGREEYQELKVNTVNSMQKLIDRNNELLIVGDFNCKEVDWENREAGINVDSWGNILLDLSSDNLLIQNVKENTRRRGEDEESRLDLAFTREEDMIQDIRYQPPLGKSDHVVINMKLLLGYQKMTGEEHKEERYDYGKANFDTIRTSFRNTDWTEMYASDSINGKYSIFKKIYEDIISNNVPKKGKIAKRIKEWFNERCRRAKERRDTAWEIARKRKNEQTWNRYKKLRNKYIKIRRQEARNHEKNIVKKCEKEPKLFFRYVNSKLKVKDRIVRLRKGDDTYEDDEGMCDIMNSTLHSVYTVDDEFTEPDNITVPVHGEAEKMDRITFQPEELLELMKGLDIRKAIGPDDISGWVVKECANELVEPLYEIFKFSLEIGKLPDDWKRANIVPIHKGGSREEPLNYRPVSLTSILCKMCEKIIKKRWIRYLEEKSLLSPSQFGFREGKATITNLLSFYDRVIDNLQKNDGWVDCVYLDIKKAFDRVPHGRLKWKLEKFGGVQGSLLKWMEDYLTGRQMRTMIGDKFSTWKEVTSGVPQGAVLAPLMFLIYINDMTKDVNSYMNMFADDAKIMRHVRNVDCCRELQEDLDKIDKWSKEWKMDFNTKKCHVMEMGRSTRRPHWEYKLGESTIVKSKKEKDLGVIVREDLSSENHINKIVGETYGLLNKIKIAFNYMDEEMLERLIKTMIRPRLEYAAVVWSPHLKKHINKLEKVQRAATRLIPELRGMSYEERLERLKLPSLEQRRERGDMITMYKCVRGIEKIDKEGFIEINNGRTRGHQFKLRKGSCKNDVKKYSFPYRSIERWNKLDKEVVNARNIHTFKERLDKSNFGDGSTRA